MLGEQYTPHSPNRWRIPTTHVLTPASLCVMLPLHTPVLPLLTDLGAARDWPPELVRGLEVASSASGSPHKRHNQSDRGAVLEDTSKHTLHIRTSAIISFLSSKHPEFYPNCISTVSLLQPCPLPKRRSSRCFRATPSSYITSTIQSRNAL